MTCERCERNARRLVQSSISVRERDAEWRAMLVCGECLRSRDFGEGCPKKKEKQAVVRRKKAGSSSRTNAEANQVARLHGQREAEPELATSPGGEEPGALRGRRLREQLTLPGCA